MRFYTPKKSTVRAIYMRRFILLVLLTISFGIKAQRKAMLYGSWKTDKKDVVTCQDSIYYDPFNPPFILTINKDRGNVFTEKCSCEKSEFLEEYQIKIRRNKIILHNVKIIDSLLINSLSLNSYDYSIYDYPPSLNYREFNYKMISDTEMVIQEKLNGEEGNCVSEFKLRKIETQHYPIASKLEEQYNNKLAEVLNKIYLEKLDSSFKTIELRVGGEFQIHTVTINKSNRTIENTDYYIDAIGKSVIDSVILVHPYSEETSFSNKEGYQFKKEKNDAPYKLNSKMKEINISEIISISYISPIETKIHKTARTIGWLSFASAVLVSPLISINYQHLDFNKERYFNTAGISLGLMTASITISTITNGTQYLIGKRFLKNGWRLINKNGS